MRKSLLLGVFLVTGFAACDGAVESFDPSSLSTDHNLEILVPRTEALDPFVDSIAHHQFTARPAPSFRGPFRITCGVGECVRLNVFLRGIREDGGSTWAAGLNCEERPPFSPLWPFKVKGPLGEIKGIRVCCPHNKPCAGIPTNDGGADWILGIMPNGRLATDLATVRTICPHLLEGAIEYDASLHRRAFTWPTNAP